MREPTQRELELQEMINILNQQKCNAEAMKYKTIAKRIRKVIQECEFELALESYQSRNKLNLNKE